MADPLLRDRAFQRIMRGLVDTGRAPHDAGHALGSASKRDACSSTT